VLFLPRERVLVTGDVLVRREDGNGAQPWTTNSYKITPWLASLRAFDALDAAITVPGQGPALRDETFLRNTIALYDAIISQVHTAMERGVVTLADVQSAMKLDDIRMRFTSGNANLDSRFAALVSALVRKVYQEAHDGVGG
jgi:glyoxylase-like metal-dependent hydrolase (beta-lactamase superfamily II)